MLVFNICMHVPWDKLYRIYARIYQSIQLVEEVGKNFLRFAEYPNSLQCKVALNLQVVTTENLVIDLTSYVTY